MCTPTWSGLSSSRSSRLPSCGPFPILVNVSGTDYFMFGIYFGGAESCLVFSAAYHLMQPHSLDVERFWHGMDLLGIVIVTVGTFVSGIYYLFICEPNLQQLHWTVVSPSERPPSLTPPSPQPGRRRATR
jgi:hypothetical protein